MGNYEDRFDENGVDVPREGYAVAMIPGAGWEAVYPGGLVSPIIAWVLHQDGSVFPVDTDGAGLVERTSKHAEIRPIGGWPESKTAGQVTRNRMDLMILAAAAGQ